ncbi:MAG: tetratricopeptide repeat protein, partial [Candidatus Omnitrophota bacterium]
MTPQRATSAWQKIAFVLLGLILSLALLEVGMRLGGFVLLSIQEYGNLRSIKQKGAYRILCLGESTTQEQYPHLLEQVLNQRNIGVRFSVIDKGKTTVSTHFILSRVESYLAEYRPDMVVAMMGINDKGVKYYEDIPGSDAWLFKHCRVYRFGRMLFMHILKKIRREGIYGSSGLDPNRKAKEDTGTEKGNAHVESGRLYQDQGNLSQTEDSLKKAILLHPENDKANVKLGAFYHDRVEFSRVEDSFKKAIELDPKNDDAYVQLGLHYQTQGKFSQTEDSFKKAIELNPKNDKAYGWLGWLYRIQGKFSEAEDFLRKAVELNPKNENAFIELGGLYRHQSRFFQAENVFKQAIEINPQSDRAFRAMASLCEEMGKLELAKEYAEKAERLGLENHAVVTVSSYRKLKEILDRK